MTTLPVFDHVNFDVAYLYLVMEYFDDNPPEEFGMVALKGTPSPGDIIQLYWLDKSPAYKLRVDRFDKSGIIHGKAVKI